MADKLKIAVSDKPPIETFHIASSHKSERAALRAATSEAYRGAALASLPWGGSAIESTPFVLYQAATSSAPAVWHACIPGQAPRMAK